MIVPFFIPHQGCRHRCVFCDQSTISGEREVIPSADDILRRIDTYRRTASENGVEVAFFGGSFTGLSRDLQERLLLPLQPLLASGEVRTVRVSTRPDAIDGDAADFLRERGVETVELGIQAMDDEILSLSGRGHTAAAAEDAVRVLKGRGFRVGVQLMPGLPGDSPARCLASLRRTLATGPDFLRIYPTVVLSGTRLAQLFADRLYVPLPLAAAVQLCKLMLHLALKAAVPVIRIGLQPTECLAADGVVMAGPFHPAFRQLVESELCHDLLTLLARGVPLGSAVTVSCAPGRVSDVAGQRRTNLERLGRRYGLGVKVVSDPLLSRQELVLRGTDYMKKGNIMHDIIYTQEDIPVV